MRPARIRSAASQLRGAKVKANVARGAATCDFLAGQCIEFLGVALREHPVVPDRRFRFDIAFPEHRLAVEVHGGTWGGAGAHVRGQHFESDCEKVALAMIAGWRVLSVTTHQARDGRAVAWLKRIAEASHAQG